MDEVIRSVGLGRRKRQRTSRRSFTVDKRQRFLDALALTCNVRRSAEHAGVPVRTIYDARANDPAFASAWQQAMEAAYDRLELLVLEHGGAGMALDTADPDRAAEEGVSAPFDFEKAMQVLRQYRARRDGQSFNRGGGKPTAAAREDTNQALLKALAAVKKRLEVTHDGGA